MRQITDLLYDFELACFAVANEQSGPTEKAEWQSTKAALLASLSHTMGVKGEECHCTKIEQDETCPVGYPSLLCDDCDGKGYVQDVNLDGPELWEIVFGIATEAAHEITDEQYSKIAEAINTVFIRSALTPTQQPVGESIMETHAYKDFIGCLEEFGAMPCYSTKKRVEQAVAAVAQPQAVPGLEKECEALRKALTLAEGRIALLLEAYPDESDGCDHPTATRYVLSEVRAALNAGVSKPEAGK